MVKVVIEGEKFANVGEKELSDSLLDLLLLDLEDISIFSGKVKKEVVDHSEVS